jgi:hypothetical protein
VKVRQDKWKHPFHKAAISLTAKKNILKTFSGEFGVVWKGYLEINGKERTVAVKSLRVRERLIFMFYLAPRFITLNTYNIDQEGML